MNTFVITGLVFDAAGVLLLGWDLVQHQRQNKRYASERLDKFDEIADEYGGINGWLSYIKDEAIWNETNYDEGRSVRVQGTFDAAAAEKSFAELISAIDGIRERVEITTELIAADARTNSKSADVSLLYSYIGLTLIVIGFMLQLIAQFVYINLDGLSSSLFHHLIHLLNLFG